MPDSVTDYGKHKFHSGSARPKIVGVYAGAGGWTTPTADERLTKGTAERLRDAGFTMVRVRHHFKTQEIILRRYLGG